MRPGGETAIADTALHPARRSRCEPQGLWPRRKIVRRQGSGLAWKTLHVTTTSLRLIRQRRLRGELRFGSPRPTRSHMTTTDGRSPGSRVVVSGRLPRSSGSSGRLTETRRLQLRGQPRHRSELRTAFPFDPREGNRHDQDRSWTIGESILRSSKNLEGEVAAHATSRLACDESVGPRCVCLQRSDLPETGKSSTAIAVRMLLASPEIDFA